MVERRDGRQDVYAHCRACLFFGRRERTTFARINSPRLPEQMIVLFLSLVAKWARRSETAFYFSGASIRKSKLPETLALLRR